MPPALRIQDVERLTLRVPFTERTRRWNALLVWQWQIVEIIRVTTDDGTVGYFLITLLICLDSVVIGSIKSDVGCERGFPHRGPARQDDQIRRMQPTHDQIQVAHTC